MGRTARRVATEIRRDSALIRAPPVNHAFNIGDRVRVNDTGEVTTIEKKLGFGNSITWLILATGQRVRPKEVTLWQGQA